MFLIITPVPISMMTIQYINHFSRYSYLLSISTYFGTAAKAGEKMLTKISSNPTEFILILMLISNCSWKVLVTESFIVYLVMEGIWTYPPARYLKHVTNKMWRLKITCYPPRNLKSNPPGKKMKYLLNLIDTQKLQ